jgi:hypothetical protein
MRGMGRIFKRGAVCWIAYYHRGKEFRESSDSDSEKEARRLLKKRIGEVGTGRFTGVREERVSFDDLANGILTDYHVNKRRSLRSARLSISHLRRVLVFSMPSISRPIGSRVTPLAASRKVRRTRASTENWPH